MKKRNLFISLGLALGLGVGVFAGLSARQEVKEANASAPGDTLYFKTNNYWDTDDPDYAAYFFGGTAGDTWVNMSLVSGSTQLYSVTIPGSAGDYTKVIFGRMNPDRPDKTNSFASGVCWNQSVDVVLSGGDYYLMYDDSWNTGAFHDGSWNIYVEGNFSDPAWSAIAENKLT